LKTKTGGHHANGRLFNKTLTGDLSLPPSTKLGIVSARTPTPLELMSNLRTPEICFFLSGMLPVVNRKASPFPGNALGRNLRSRKARKPPRHRPRFNAAGGPPETASGHPGSAFKTRQADGVDGRDQNSLLTTAPVADGGGQIYLFKSLVPETATFGLVYGSAKACLLARARLIVDTVSKSK